MFILHYTQIPQVKSITKLDNFFSFQPVMKPSHHRCTLQTSMFRTSTEPSVHT